MSSSINSVLEVNDMEANREPVKRINMKIRFDHLLSVVNLLSFPV
ncbi:MAG: hypothetical protein ACW981_17220 [Candidatus Hodarchaeales archaeon]